MSELITAIDFEAYTALNSDVNQHVKFVEGSDGMWMRVTDSTDADRSENGKMKSESTMGMCGLLQGVFQTCSSTKTAYEALDLRAEFIKTNGKVYPQLVYREYDSASNVVSTWQMRAA